VSDPDIFCDTGTCAEDAELKAECEDAFLLCLVDEPDEEECVALALLICEPGCATGADCGAGEICVDTRCVSDPDIFCDTGTCAEDAELKAECEDAFLLCLVDEPDEEECVALALLICAPAGGPCEGEADGTPCMCPICGADGLCMSGVCEDPVIGAGSGTTSWRALPKLCTQGVFDATAFTYVCDPAGETDTDVPGGGLASGTSDPTSVVDGCAVPSTVLGGQLAVDVFLDTTAISTGDGNLTTGHEIRAVNAGLGIAAAITNLVDLSIVTSITSGNPSSVLNFLNSNFQNTPLAQYIAGLPATLTLSRCVPDGVGGCTTGQIDDATEAVSPTSFPNVNVNFSANFLLELFLTSAGSPLNVDGASCVFDNPGAGITLPVQAE
jgi:hypothetical protein